jgi:aminopeptidase N
MMPASSALRSVLRHPALDAAFKELVLTLPSETYIAEQLDVVDPQRIHAVREAMRLQLAMELQADWQWAWAAHPGQRRYRPDAVIGGSTGAGGPGAGDLCLAATQTGDADLARQGLQRFKDAGNMTDRANALQAWSAADTLWPKAALTRFHALFKDEALVLDKWFALQAGAPDRGGHVLPAVRQLMRIPTSHAQPQPGAQPDLQLLQCQPRRLSPRRRGRLCVLERAGAELDSINPQVAARLARALDRWKKLAEPYRSAAREAIARVAARKRPEQRCARSRRPARWLTDSLRVRHCV